MDYVWDIRTWYITLWLQSLISSFATGNNPQNTLDQKELYTIFALAIVKFVIELILFRAYLPYLILSNALYLAYNLLSYFCDRYSIPYVQSVLNLTAFVLFFVSLKNAGHQIFLCLIYAIFSLYGPTAFPFCNTFTNIYTRWLGISPLPFPMGK